MTAKQKDNIYIILALLLMAVLFYSSSQPYSDQSIMLEIEQYAYFPFLENLLEMVDLMYGEQVINLDNLGYAGLIEFFIRKSAHFFSYFLLGLLWFLGLRRRMGSYTLTAVVALMITVGYASFDEIHQLFVSERTGMIQDVFLDSLGGLTGVIIAWLQASKFWK